MAIFAEPKGLVHPENGYYTTYFEFISDKEMQNGQAAVRASGIVLKVYAEALTMSASKTLLLKVKNDLRSALIRRNSMLKGYPISGFLLETTIPR
jgi:hypothetical protein